MPWGQNPCSGMESRTEWDQLHDIESTETSKGLFKCTRTNRIEQSKSLQGKLQSQIWKLRLWERFSLTFTASHSFKVNCLKNRLGCELEDDKDQAKNKTDSGCPLTPRLNLQATSGWKPDWRVNLYWKIELLTALALKKKWHFTWSWWMQYHFTRRKYKGSSLGVPYPHDHSCKTLSNPKSMCQLWRTYNNRRYE
jgi:hypothetical protein